MMKTIMFFLLFTIPAYATEFNVVSCQEHIHVKNGFNGQLSVAPLTGDYGYEDCPAIIKSAKDNIEKQRSDLRKKWINDHAK